MGDYVVSAKPVLPGACSQCGGLSRHAEDCPNRRRAPAETWTENAAPASHSCRCRAVNGEGDRCRKSNTLPHEHVSKAPPFDREPQPTDGPDYHADHAAWSRRQATNSPNTGAGS